MRSLDSWIAKPLQEKPIQNTGPIDVNTLAKPSNGGFTKITQVSDSAILGENASKQLKMVKNKASESTIVKTTENSKIQRKRVSFTNEESKQFEEVNARIDELKVYGKPMESILEILEKTSGDVYDAECYLKGKPVAIWTALEDMVLRQPSSNDMYKFLQQSKGRIALMKRKRFLQISE